MTPDDVLALIDGHVAAAAVGAAMERGIFWLVAAEPRDATQVAATLSMPVEQCSFWLEHLANLGLLDRVAGGYVTSAAAKAAIVDAYSRDTWAFLARSAREELATVTELAAQLADAAAAGPTTDTDYVDAMREDPIRAQQFTRMLYEIHLPLAEEVAATTPIEGVGRLLDVGGGSGVMSLALLRKAPQLTAIVFDIPSVCSVGREIAAENGFEDRIQYRPGDFVEDDLPSGFDMILYCDVGGYTETLLQKLHTALEPGGQIVIVDKFGAGPGLPHSSRSHWALVGSVRDAAPRRFSADEVETMLVASGFSLESRLELPARKSRWSSGWTMITARA